MKRKYSFATAFVAIAMVVTMHQVQRALLSFRAQDYDPTGMVRLLRDPSLHNGTNRSVGEMAVQDAAASQWESRSTNSPVEHVRSPTEGPKNVTIVCEMSGELGNHLGHFARCRGIALWLQQEHNVSSHQAVRFRRTTDIEMWEAAQDTIRACFPKLSGYTVEQANNETFLSRKKEQAKLKLSLSGVDSKDASRFESALLGFVNYTSRRPLQHENSTITLPFIHSTAMSSLDFVMDRYVDDIRDLLELDQAKAACCSLKPDPDETVFVSDTIVLLFQRRPLKLSHVEARRCSHSTFETLERSFPIVRENSGFRSLDRSKRLRNCLAT
jgi:hypothetical protein